LLGKIALSVSCNVERLWIMALAIIPKRHVENCNILLWNYTQTLTLTSTPLCISISHSTFTRDCEILNRHKFVAVTLWYNNTHIDC